MLTFKVAVPFCITTSNKLEFLLLHIPHQHLVLSVFQILAILIGMQWYLTAIFIFDSLMAKDVEYLMLIFHLYIFFDEVSVQMVSHFLIGGLVFLSLSFKSPLYSLEIWPLSDTCFAKILSQSEFVYSFS